MRNALDRVIATGRPDLKNPISIADALRASLSRTGLILAAGIGVLEATLNLLPRDTAAGGWAMVALSLILSGYYLGYSRSVALGSPSRFPSPLDIWSHLRRGISMAIVSLPALLPALPAALVVLLVAAVPYRLDWISRATSFTLFSILFFGAAVTALTLPFLGVYILEDRISPSFRVRDNFRNAWSKRGLLVAPVSVAAFATAFQAALFAVAGALTDAPLFTPGHPTRLVGSAELGRHDVAALAALVVACVAFSVVGVASAHVQGQYAASLRDQGEPV